MERLRSLIKEVLTVQPKKDCNCGCGGCNKKAPIITEGRIKKAISEGLTYHVENKIPLHESVYRIGSEKHFALINEARKLWTRGLIDVSEDDQAILETHLGNFGMYEGEKVPLDMPMVNEEKEYYVTYNKGRGQGKGLVKSKESNYEEPRVFSKEEAEEYAKEAESRSRQMTAYWVSDKDMNRLNEGQDKWVVYDTKTKKRLPNAGKIYKDRKAAQAFADKQENAEVASDTFYFDKIQESSLNEAANSGASIQWPDELDSYYGMVTFKKVNEFQNGSIAKYDIILNKTGEVLESREFQFLSNLEYMASDYALPKGGTQSTNLGESLDEELEKDYIEHLQNVRNDFYNKGDKEKAAEVQADIDKLLSKSLDEAKKKKKKEKKDPPLGKPKRGGSKAYYVYVRDPKTKRIKKVSFGSGGLRAKIKNKEARKRFASRHNCDKKKDRTTAGYWSCNLPRYAEQLGLGSKMNTFW